MDIDALFDSMKKDELAAEMAGLEAQLLMDATAYAVTLGMLAVAQRKAIALALAEEVE